MGPQLVCSPKIVKALAQLADARRYAEDAGEQLQEFAVEVDELGLQRSDLRWLIAKGYAEHLQETTRRGAAERAFKPADKIAFSKRSCLLLTPAGLAFFRNLSIPAVPVSLAVEGVSFPLNAIENKLPKAAAVPPAPSWDAVVRELRLGELLVKQFRVPAPNQEAILNAFQEENWPRLIDDPLPPQFDQNAKLRLHHTIRNLNCHQKHRLIHFEGDGSGQRVLWRAIEQGA